MATFTESTTVEIVPGACQLSNQELDEKLEEQVLRHEESEQLICCYLTELRDRRGYGEFGYTNVYDYAGERFGFSERKTRYLLSLGRKLQELPRLRAALKKGEIGWCKASRVASVAKPEDEAMWLDSALSLSVRELDRRIKDGTDTMASTLSFWLTEEQRQVWENALEICRRVAGSEIPPGQALEYLAGEFLATYGHLLREETETSEEGDEAVAEGLERGEVPPPQPMLSPEWETRVCPDHEDELPSVVDPVPYDETWREVLERDGYGCRYPGCSARSQLHVHHILYRSRGGRKAADRIHAPWNLLTICAFHHRMVHAKVMGVSGRAPHELSWRPPKLMEQVLERRRKHPGYWVSELEVRSFPVTSRAMASVAMG